MLSPGWVSARGCTALGLIPMRKNTALVWGFACPIEGVLRGLLLPHSELEHEGRWHRLLQGGQWPFHGKGG